MKECFSKRPDFKPQNVGETNSNMDQYKVNLPGETSPVTLDWHFEKYGNSNGDCIRVYYTVHKFREKKGQETLKYVVGSMGDHKPTSTYKH